VTICREWSIVNQERNIRHARMLYCKSWNCPTCRPKRRSQLLAKCASGHPTRLITLTVNPSHGESPEQRLRLLSRAWRVCVKRLRRRYGQSSIDYLAIVEKTKHGEPHLHILARCPYIPQPYLSAVMKELIDAPIVDIRRIKSARNAILYVAKYVTKEPERIGTAKRYWSSITYEIDQSEKPTKNTNRDFPYTVSPFTLAKLARAWNDAGWRIASADEDSFTAEYRNPPGTGSESRQPVASLT